MIYFLDELNEENIKDSDIFSIQDLDFIRKLDDYDISIFDEKFFKKAIVNIDDETTLEITTNYSKEIYYRDTITDKKITIENSSEDDLSYTFYDLFLDVMEPFISETSFADDSIE